MQSNSYYNEVLTEHNMRPLHKHKLPDASFSLEGINPSCGDDIILNLKVEDGIITGGSFEGSGCAISQASADIMLDLVIGKSKEEALRLGELFFNMIKGNISDEELEALDDASLLQDISYMTANVNAPVLAWHTMKKISEEKPS